ncbi:hypothetical protein Moror_10279 [Moniliophthora roreri MCA 2997]|uniref:Uncharacterized protein n=2 Tax=Moniliophthora roreri TaxID=221103 RepID=V2XEI1_MONRO|nr:hypothetical protein Moror_10279 [Moniliophthora roreri MCA 2997]KAI3604815.1 hypothetical protein WG66_008371 [Moniliophthora roreri]
MRFPLLRRLSHLIHRRPKSESFAVDVLNQFVIDDSDEEQLPRSQSLGNPDDICILPPHLLDLLLQHPVPTSLNDILVALANLERRIPIVEMEIMQLQQKKDRILFESQLVQEEIRRTKANLDMDEAEKRKAVEVEEKLKEMERREDHLGKILATLPRNSTPVFHEIAAAIDAGKSFQHAAISVIRELVDKPDSPWSKLVPAVVGDRSSDQYASALSMVLKTRKDIKHGRNVAQFWKKQAKLDEANANLVTPSASTLSDVQIALSEERKRAVDDLLRKLRSGEIPVRSRVLTQAAPICEGDSANISPTVLLVSSELSAEKPLLSTIPSTSAIGEFNMDEKDLSRISTLAVSSTSLPTLPSQSELLYLQSTATENHPTRDLKSIPEINKSSSSQSFVTSASVSSSEPSSTSSFASVDIFNSDIWESSPSLSKLQPPASISRSDDGDISSFPIPGPHVRNPPQCRVPPPRTSPFGGLETINESEEPSSSSSYYSSIPSASILASSSRPDTTLVAASSSDANDITLVIAEDQAVEKNAPSQSLSASRAKKSFMTSRLPRRLSVLLSPKKPKVKKGKEKMVEVSPAKLEQGRKPLGIKSNLVQTKRSVAVNPASRSQTVGTRTRANSGASARPTISSSIKQVEAQERLRAMKEKENFGESRTIGKKNIGCETTAGKSARVGSGRVPPGRKVKHA